MLCQAIAIQTSRWECMCFCRALRGLVNSANSNEVCQSRQIGVDEWRGSSSTIDNARIVHLLSWASRAYAGVLWDHWAIGTHQKEQIVVIENPSVSWLRPWYEHLSLIELLFCWNPQFHWNLMRAFEYCLRWNTHFTELIDHKRMEGGEITQLENHSD